MYGHRVIEDLQKMLTSKDPHLHRWVDWATDALKSAQHFHIVDGDDILEFGKTHSGGISINQLFSGDWGMDIRCPYSSCWISYNVTKFKPPISRGVLVVEIAKDLIQVVSFEYHPEKNGWTPSPFCHTIGINTLPYQHPALDNSFKRAVPAELQGKTVIPGVWCDKEKYGVVGKEALKFLRQDGEYLCVLNIFLMLLSCKNITTRKHPPPERLNKARKKKGREPIFLYKTLSLKLPPTKGDREEHGEKPGETRRLHLCRGHFKTYTKEAPLFGRITGRYWWQPHIKGSKKKGAVIKDYEVLPIH